eukprot:PITA_29667
MAEQAIICKFMGIWPSERTLCHWIKQHWKPRGDVKLHLGAKGFFTVVFSNLEDNDRVFEGDPYFLASAGLYMRPWKPNFAPEKESFTQVPVWIRLFSLPIYYWGLNALKQIGDKLGTFIKASEATLQKRYTSYARICVEMDVFGALHEGIWLEYRDKDYFEDIDYEQIPFWCRKYPETDSEDKQKTLTSEAEHEEKEKPTREGTQEGDLNNEVQMQERIEETEEETDMLTSDDGSEDQEWEEALAKEGMNLPVIAEN